MGSVRSCGWVFASPCFSRRNAITHMYLRYPAMFLGYLVCLNCVVDIGIWDLGFGIWDKLPANNLVQNCGL